MKYSTSYVQVNPPMPQTPPPTGQTDCNGRHYWI